MLSRTGFGISFDYTCCDAFLLLLTSDLSFTETYALFWNIHMSEYTKQSIHFIHVYISLTYTYMATNKPALYCNIHIEDQKTKTINRNYC